jgi:hypothetical protein
MAGTATVVNMQQFTTSMSNTVLQDPSSLNMALGTADMALEATIKADPNLSPATVAALRGEHRDQMRSEIAKSAFIGTARTNPDVAMQDLQAGKYKDLLDGTTSNQLFGFAETIKREQRADARAAVEMTRQQQGDDFKAKVAAVSASMFAADGSLVIPPNFHQNLQMLSLHPGAISDPGAIRALGDAAAKAVENANGRVFQTTNAATWRDLASRIGTADGSPGALTHALVDQAYANGNLSNTDYHFLHTAVETSKADPATEGGDDAAQRSPGARQAPGGPLQPLQRQAGPERRGAVRRPPLRHLPALPAAPGPRHVRGRRGEEADGPARSRGHPSEPGPVPDEQQAGPRGDPQPRDVRRRPDERLRAGLDNRPETW